MDLNGALSVAKLVAVLGTVEGRKRLQKIVHLLKAKGHPEFRQSFVLYYFGPFSRRVAAQLDFVVQAEFVKESVSDGRYSYTASEEKRSLVNELRGDGEEAPEWAEFAKALDKKGTPFLEALSTFVFLRKSEVTAEQLDRAFRRAKPHLVDHLAPAKKFAEREFPIREEHETRR